MFVRCVHGRSISIPLIGSSKHVMWQVFHTLLLLISNTSGKELAGSLQQTNKSIVPINHLVEPTRLAAKARYRLWFLWTEFKLKLALGEMDLEGL